MGLQVIKMIAKRANQSEEEGERDREGEWEVAAYWQPAAPAAAAD